MSLGHLAHIDLVNFRPIEDRIGISVSIVNVSPVR
jgi:hypothetical protein